MSIAQRIESIRQEIPPSVRLIAISKQVSVAKIREAYAAGIRDFGENRLQEALSKQEELADLPDICWHFIGHLQTNKAKKTLENFQWIHSVDNLALLQRLDRLAADLSTAPQICLQVKMLPDPNKYGWQISELLSHLSEIEACQTVSIRGLMTILPLGLTPDEILSAFESTAKLARQIEQQSSLRLTELSMGMSNDYLSAIAAGATMIRLGRTLFGERT
ncbi:MAG: YggS family pyridoxal phosphate-dependent enzyme [Snowella sp.]|nr:YggS family pyridoxal phosphate-dependent enzyme [Snowella sp.]